jgi:hypothetical protein
MRHDLARFHAPDRQDREETGMTTLISDIEAFGRAEGQIQERKAIVLRQLTRKLGPLDQAMTERVATLTPEALLDLSDALLDFTALPDLSAWLDQHPRAEAP